MKSALVDPEDGAVMGFNLAMNDDDGVNEGNRKIQLNWSGQPHSEFTYGSLTLSSETLEGGSPAGNLSVSQSGDGLVLEWEGTGTLESAPSILGPWSVIDGASSPLSVTPAGTEAYYRVQ